MKVLLVLRELRLHPSEIDLVIFDRETLRLATFEIKRNNWRALMDQAVRAKLYSHFSSAILPISMRSNVPENEFSQRGLGLIFYEETVDEIDLKLVIQPKLSDSINRSLKQQVYRRFYEHYGEKMYA